MEDLISKLIDIVQKTAPELWKIANKQVLATNVMDGMIAIALIIAIIIALVYMSKLKNIDATYREEREKGKIYIGDCEYGLVKIIGWIGIVTGVVIAICNITSIIMRLINPEYYAIQILMGLIK